MLEKIELQIAYGAVKHFGRNLYTSNPPALAELIANSWDAYSTRCDLFFDDNKKSLLLLDDGIGMTDQEFCTRYAVSGKEKNVDEIRVPKDFDIRPYMGKKGIGKFSAFSLGEHYTLYTKSESDDKWKKIQLSYQDLLVEHSTVDVTVEYIESLGELKKFFPNVIEPSHGTAIFITDMKRRITKATKDGVVDTLSKMLVRRFSVSVLKKFSFAFYLNGTKVNLTKHFYDKNLEFIYYFGFDKKDMMERFPSMSDSTLFKEESDFFSKNHVTGWVGTVKKTDDLQLEDRFSSRGIIVYINGKLADENIVKYEMSNRVSDMYMIGEVNANFLQTEHEDPVLSSREGLNHEIENVELLTKELMKISKIIKNKWSDLRAQRPVDNQAYLGKLLELDNYKTIYDNYNEREQKNVNYFAQKIFDGKTKEYSTEEYKTYAPVIFSLANSKSIKEIKIADEETEDDKLVKIFNMFEKTGINEALRIKSNIDDRLKIINELQTAIDDEAIERVFEKCLERHPWLIHPYWDKVSNKVVVDTQQKYSFILDGNKVSGRSDLIIKVSEESYPIICELKREKKTNYSAPDVDEITSQIRKYRRGIIELLKKEEKIEIPRDKIKAYYICGQKAFEKLSSDDMADLYKNSIEVCTYQKLIRIAEGVYYAAMKE